MNLAGKLASVSEVSDPANFQWLATMCGKAGFSIKEMQSRIRPVARALGLYGIQQNENYYQLLGVKQGATGKEIRTAYRTKVRRFHPDTRDDHEMDEESFVALTTAYKTLSNPTLRHQYNLEIHTDGIWDEGPKSQKNRHKKQRKSKVKFVFLFSMILIFLAGTMLFSDILFNLDVMREISEQLFDKNQNTTGDSDLPSGQSTQGKNFELEDRSDTKAVPSNFGPILDKQDAQNLKQAIEPKSEVSQKLKQDILKPDTELDATEGLQNPGTRATKGISSGADGSYQRYTDEKQATGISKTKSDRHTKPSTMGSEGSAKPTALENKIGKQKNRGLQSEAKVLDLIENPPTREKLQLFLNRYTSAYQSRNETRFFDFFTPGAKENDQPIDQIFPIYRQTFRDFENIDYRIHLKEYLVDLNETTIKIKGGYRLNWNSRQDGVRHSITGDLSMILVSDNNFNYKILALNY